MGLVTLADAFLAFTYAQFINLAETLLWIERPWGLKPPFPTAEEEVEDEGYHALLAALYVVPFAILYYVHPLKVVVLSVFVWFLNDTTWHFWAVNPRYYLQWLRFYFNPRDRRVVWYARFGIGKFAVTPRRMFIVTIVRIAVLVLALCT